MSAFIGSEVFNNVEQLVNQAKEAYEAGKSVVDDAKSHYDSGKTVADIISRMAGGEVAKEDVDKLIEYFGAGASMFSPGLAQVLTFAGKGINKLAELVGVYGDDVDEESPEAAMIRNLQAQLNNESLKRLGNELLLKKELTESDVAQLENLFLPAAMMLDEKRIKKVMEDNYFNVDQGEFYSYDKKDRMTIYGADNYEEYLLNVAKQLDNTKVGRLDRAREILREYGLDGLTIKKMTEAEFNKKVEDRLKPLEEERKRAEETRFGPDAPREDAVPIPQQVISDDSRVNQKQSEIDELVQREMMKYGVNARMMRGEVMRYIQSFPEYQRLVEELNALKKERRSLDEYVDWANKTYSSQDSAYKKLEQSEFYRRRMQNK